MNDWMKPICGAMIVRRANENYEVSDVEHFGRPPRIGDLLYSGIDRLPFYDVDEMVRTGRLALKWLHCIQAFEGDNFTGMRLGPLDVITRLFLELEATIRNRNEILAVYSHKLANLLKTKEEVASSRLEWLGYDVLDLGNWSLLKEGVFLRPERFDWQRMLNRNGLMAHAHMVSQLLESYREAARHEILEELVEEPYGIETIGVYRVI